MFKNNNIYAKGLRIFSLVICIYLLVLLGQLVFFKNFYFYIFLFLLILALCSFTLFFTFKYEKYFVSSFIVLVLIILVGILLFGTLLSNNQYNASNNVGETIYFLFFTKKYYLYNPPATTSFLNSINLRLFMFEKIVSLMILFNSYLFLIIYKIIKDKYEHSLKYEKNYFISVIVANVLFLLGMVTVNVWIFINFYTITFILGIYYYVLASTFFIHAITGNIGLLKAGNLKKSSKNSVIILFVLNGIMIWLPFIVLFFGNDSH